MRQRGQSGYTLVDLCVICAVAAILPAIRSHGRGIPWTRNCERSTAKAKSRLKSQAGYSLIELCIVAALGIILAVMAVPIANSITPRMQSNAALYQTMSQLRTGREMAISQRRNIELRFLGNNQIQLVRDDVPNGTTTLSTVTLEGKIQFRLFDGIPDTPDAFGNGTAISFGGAAQLIFLSDGTLVDAQGTFRNGSIFIGLDNHPETARAVTVLGGTGRIRGYRWTGTNWIQ